MTEQIEVLGQFDVRRDDPGKDVSAQRRFNFS